MIIHISSIDIEYSDLDSGMYSSPLDQALDRRFPGTTHSSGDDSVKVFSKVRGDEQWSYSPRLRSYQATSETGHPEKPGWFWLPRIKNTTGG